MQTSDAESNMPLMKMELIADGHTKRFHSFFAKHVAMKMRMKLANRRKELSLIETLSDKSVSEKQKHVRHKAQVEYIQDAAEIEVLNRRLANLTYMFHAVRTYFHYLKLTVKLLEERVVVFTRACCQLMNLEHPMDLVHRYTTLRLIHSESLSEWDNVHLHMEKLNEEVARAEAELVHNSIVLYTEKNALSFKLKTLEEESMQLECDVAKQAASASYTARTLMEASFQINQLYTLVTANERRLTPLIPPSNLHLQLDDIERFIKRKQTALRCIWSRGGVDAGGDRFGSDDTHGGYS